MKDGLVPQSTLQSSSQMEVLILVVVDNGLVHVAFTLMATDPTES